MTRTKRATKPLIDPDAIGVEVSWSFGDGNAEAVTMPRTTLAELLSKHGFDPGLLPEVSEDLALRKARHTVKGRSKTLVIQELRRPNKDTPRAFGVYKVCGQDGEKGDDMVMGARVRCEAQRVVCLPPEGEDQTVFTDSDCEKVGKEMARIANSLLDNVINGGISDVLVSIGWDLGWISRRRNSGGVYFASSSEPTERFVALLQAIAGESGALAANKRNARNYYFIPQTMEVYAKPLTIGMWKDSAKDQYEQQTAQLLKDLQQMQGADGDKMRATTVQARADECDRLMQLAESHRLFLADAVAGITRELAQLKNGFQKRIDANSADATAAFDAIDQATPKRTRRKKVGAVDKDTVPDLSTMSTDDLFGVDS